MAAPGYSIKGFDPLLARFKNAPRLIEAELEDAGDTIFARAIEILATEPAPPSGSKYQRTHRLVNTWRETDRRFVVAGNSRSAVLRNATPYVGVVQSKGSQAKVHKGRWATIEDTELKLAPFAAQKLQEAGENVAAALAGK